MKKRTLVGIAALAVAAMAANAAVIVDYQFPASYDGTGTAVTDLSGNSNDGAVRAQGASDLSASVPTGETGNSLDLKITNFDTDATGLIDLDNVWADGGLKYELWYNNGNAASSDWQDLIGFGGSDGDLMVGTNHKLRFRGDGGDYVDTTDNILSAADWHQIVMQLTPVSRDLDADTITGTVAIFVDGVNAVTGDNNVLVRQSDYNTEIGFGVRGGGNANNRANGLMYNPSIETIPEPATLGLVAVFGGAVLFVRRKLMM